METWSVVGELISVSKHTESTYSHLQKDFTRSLERWEKTLRVQIGMFCMQYKHGTDQWHSYPSPLIDLQDKLKKIKDIKELGPKNVTNALFVGSTTELQKMIKKNKDKK